VTKYELNQKRMRRCQEAARRVGNFAMEKMWRQKEIALRAKGDRMSASEGGENVQAL